MSRLSLLCAVAAALGALLLTTSTAAAVSSVGPNQTFVGVANGQLSPARLVVSCATHHVQSGTVGVRLGSDPGPLGLAGFTGSSATSISGLMLTPTFAFLGTFSVYADELFPSTATLPCTGSGTILFTPSPGTGNQRPAMLRLSITPA